MDFVMPFVCGASLKLKALPEKQNFLGTKKKKVKIILCKLTVCKLCIFRAKAIKQQADWLRGLLTGSSYSACPGPKPWLIPQWKRCEDGVQQSGLCSCSWCHATVVLTADHTRISQLIQSLLQLHLRNNNLKKNYNLGLCMCQTPSFFPSFLFLLFAF